MRTRRYLLAPAAALLLSVTVSAKDGWFGWAPYGHPLYADTHPDMCRLDIAGITMNDVYDYGGKGGKMQPHVVGTFGFNLPIWSGNPGDGRFGLNLTLPLSATLWMDLFEKVTSDVVNTDYRIGGPALTFIHRLSDGGFLRNYSIYLEPYKHESTHVGDELVLQRRNSGYALNRVNVSYNFIELKFTLNEPENRCDRYHTFRGALMIPYFLGRGWYFVEERDGQIDQVPGSHPEKTAAGTDMSFGPKIRMPEWYLQYQWQSRTAKCGIQGIVSAELRGRALYGYDLGAMAGAAPAAATEDSLRLTVNSFVGIRYNGGRDGYLSRFAFGIRAYYGNCPYGMFRSVRDFSQVGACIIFQ